MTDVLVGCNRLFSSKERLLPHRKKDHNTTDVDENIITWNEDDKMKVDK